jgi:undecaprenyl-diphosphatase
VDLLLLLKALILGIVEGVTEFLPVSSTGHLILAGDLLDFNDERGKLFEIVIQSGAILAVCWEYRAKIAQVLRGLPSDPGAQRFALNHLVAFLPLAIIGLLFGKTIKAYLFNAPAGGYRLHRWRPDHPLGRAPRASHPRRVGRRADVAERRVKLGFAQALALIPGTSRSGATIIGGLLFGLSRRAATEFSFFLAMPTLIGRPSTSFTRSARCSPSTISGCGASVSSRRSFRPSGRALAAALYQHARLLDLCLVSHRLRHRRAGDLAVRLGILDEH